MKLTKATIHRYRSIEESTTFDVEGDVTCLVGKNESGKTATLQALYKSNPMEKVTFDGTLDYPSHKTRELNAAPQKRMQATTLTYELDEEDVTAVEQHLGAGAVQSRTITISVSYGWDTTTWTVDIDEQVVTRHLRGSMELPPTAAAAADTATNVEDLLATLGSLEAPTSESQAVIETVDAWPHPSGTRQAIAVLEHRQPKFVYFGDYDIMPGKVSIPGLIRDRDADDLNRGQRALLALLAMAGCELEDFSAADGHERLTRQLENASNTISDEVFTYWSQNRSLQVSLKVIAEAEAGAPPPLDIGPLLEIRVVNLRHRVSVQFDERSRGFVWFFSFLAYFDQLEREAQQPLILLLDEPGLSLHATAQHDLLRFIDDRLAPRHQVLFSTHSPFMIDPRQFQRVRTVVDHKSGGTTVSADVLRVDGESAFPLHAALGIELTQTLFIGPEVLFVEGPSDVVYLQYLSEQLRAAGREGLDERWVLVPGGGITKIPAFLALFGANDMTLAILVDSSDANSAAMTELRKAGKLYAGGLVAVGEALERAEADIEDLLDQNLYVDLVNTSYAGAFSGKEPLTVADLKGGDRIVKDVEAVFTERGINNGRLNHFSPAAALLRSKTTPKASKAVLERAERLTQAINRQLTNQSPKH